MVNPCMNYGRDGSSPVLISRDSEPVALACDQPIGTQSSVNVSIGGVSGGARSSAAQKRDCCLNFFKNGFRKHNNSYASRQQRLQQQ